MNDNEFSRYDPANRYDNRYQKRKRRNRARMFLTLLVCVLLCAILALALVLLFLHKGNNGKRNEAAQMTETAQGDSAKQQADADAGDTDGQTGQTSQTGQMGQAGQAGQNDQDTLYDQDTLPSPPAKSAALQETDIYTFLQGPKSWEAKVDWSGSWCHEVLADQEFSVFGCGLCVLANIYGTLTDCDCSPLDMFWYAREVSGYAPSSGYGAIDWPYMRQTLQTVGISSKLRMKNVSYRQFQEAIAGSICTVALVSSYNDDTYWQDVEGHYVTIWLYDREDDTVFLSDSGNPDHNRQRIPLRYIYDALKTYGTHQYMMITDVDPSGNTWQHNGIDIKWRKPKYYQKKTG